MKIMVTGAMGMLGRACVHAFSRDHVCVGVDIADGDLTRSEVVEELLTRHQPQWIVHTAAFTDVDGAESAQQRATAVNRDATGLLAQGCEARGSGLTYISTDYVFPGDCREGYAEDAARRPINHYGVSKAGGEEAVETLRSPWQIVRTSWLFGPGERNFVLTMRRLLSQRQTIRVVDDQKGCPTYAPDLADLLLFLVQSGRSGYYHGTNAGVCSWYEFAGRIAVLSGLDPGRITACGSRDYPTPARRPEYSILLSRNLEALGCPPRRDWPDALRDYVDLLDTPGAPAAKGVPSDGQQ